MNLLSDCFINDNEIIYLNKKYFLVTMVIFILILFLMIVRKDYYYQNTLSFVDGKTLLLVEKEYINNVKDNQEIIIDEIKCGYSINEITAMDEVFLVEISLKPSINNISSKTYKVNIGKEKLLDYIIRIIKK